MYYTEEDIEAFEEEKFWQNVLADVKKSLISKSLQFSSHCID